MEYSPLNKIRVSLISLTLIVGWAMHISLVNRQSQMQSQILSQQQTMWANEDAAETVAKQQAAATREKIFVADETKALGGPLGMAIKNPDQNIRQMLEQIALVCAPSNTQVSVTVDRFTEFSVSLTLSAPMTFSQMAVLAQKILSHGTPYIYSLRFVRGNDVLAELDDADIESAAKPGNDSVSSIEKFLLAAASPNSSEPEPDSQSSDTSTQELTPNQLAVSRGRKNFNDELARHMRRLNELVAELNRDTQLESVQQESQLQSTIASLNQVVSGLANERDFLMNQPDEFERSLQGENLDPVLISVLKRQFIQRDESQTALMQDLLDALSDYQQKTRSFLTRMDDLWGEWKIVGTRRIQFTSEAARDAYNREDRLLRISQRAVKDALGNLSDQVQRDKQTSANP